ncbi:MAG: DUF4251 domain-containing protein [Dysgonomonas sp.]
MKKFGIGTLLFALIGIFVLASCSTKQNSVAQQAKAELIRTKVESRNLTFIPNMAIPMGYKPISLTPVYDLTISGDTLSVDLPYYGRSHTPPVDPTKIGIQFQSVDFDYQVKAKKDVWEITLNPRGENRNTTLYLTVGNSGYADLRVTDRDRQSISYNGYIDLGE